MNEDLMIQEDLLKVSKLEGREVTLEELSEDPDFRAYAERGNTLYDAWYLSNRGKIVEKAVTQAVAEDRKARESTAHLSPTPERGTLKEVIPRDVYELYTALNPDCTGDEIRKSWRSYKTSK